ncbi:Hypothetical predicted protein [Mytilus galloprovincialis]|uniref:Uncharacterized protein n=1 Tax=Mytilus galloprovincialis TaxID=29158 RepID=A0A8B6FQX3_MYTGA|nr:Hypothetical predicted protein [Mytilus galloprovincialis]
MANFSVFNNVSISTWRKKDGKNKKRGREEEEDGEEEKENKKKMKREKVVFPDGTVYSLTASWVADPSLATLQEAGVQTSPEKLKSSTRR